MALRRSSSSKVIVLEGASFSGIVSLLYAGSQAVIRDRLMTQRRLRPAATSRNLSSFSEYSRYCGVTTSFGWASRLDSKLI